MSAPLMSAAILLKEIVGVRARILARAEALKQVNADYISDTDLDLLYLDVLQARLELAREEVK